MIGFWFILQLLNGIVSLGASTAQTSGVAFWAHVGGFGAGLIMTLVWRAMGNTKSASATG